MQYYVVTSSPNASLHPSNHPEIVDVDRSYKTIMQSQNGPLLNHGAEKPDVVECHSAGCSSPASSLKSVGDAPWSPGASEVPKITKTPRVQLVYGLSSDTATAKMGDPLLSPGAPFSSHARRESAEDAEDSKYDQPLNLSTPRRHVDDDNKQNGARPDIIGDNHKEYSGKDKEKANSRVQYLPVPYLENTVRSRVPSLSQSLNRQDDESLKTKDNGDQGDISLTDSQTHKREYDTHKSLQETTDTDRIQNETILSPESLKSLDHSENLKKQFAAQNCAANSNEGAIKKKRRSKNGSSKKHMCPYCSKGFPLPWKLKIHLRVHTGEKPYQCHICGKRFSVQCNLRDHIQLHTGNRPWKCNKCPAKFSWPSQLKAHARVHSGEKPYKCQYCPLSFAWSSSRTHHERGHRGEKNYECKTCSTKFQRKSALLNHLRTHYSIKQFVCKFCNRSYSHKNSLKQHERKHTGEAPYICSCGEKFQTTRNFRKHQSVLHNSECPFICQVCLLNFKSERDLTEHDQILHKEKEGHQEHDTKDYRCSQNSDSNDHRNRQGLHDLASSINDDKLVKNLSRKTGRFCNTDGEYQNTTSNKDIESVYNRVTVAFTNSDKLVDTAVQNLSQKSSPSLDTDPEDSRPSACLKDDTLQSSSPPQVQKPLDFSDGDKTSHVYSPSGTPSPTKLLSPKEPSADFGLDLRKVNPEQQEHDCTTEPLPKKSAFRDVRGQNSSESRLQNRFQRFLSEYKTDPLIRRHKSYHQVERLEISPIYHPSGDNKDNPHSPPYNSHAFPHSPIHDRVLAERLAWKLPQTQQHGYLAEIFRNEERKTNSLRQLLKQQPLIDALPKRYVYRPLQLKQNQDSENKSHCGVPDYSCQIYLPRQIQGAKYDQLHSEHTALVQRLGDLYGRV